MAVKTFPMRTPRALVAANPLQFGRAPAWPPQSGGEARWTASDDLRLFASIFAAGFLFVSILIG